MTSTPIKPTPTATAPAPPASVPDGPKPQPKAAPKAPDQQVAAAPASTPKPKPAPAAPPAAPATPRAEFPSWATSVSAEAGDADKEQSTAEANSGEEEQPGRLRRFFGSIWSSDDEDESEPSGDDSGTRRAVVATAEWSKTTKVEEISESQAATSGAGGARSYRIQLASSRSEDEARSYWQRISSQHRGIVGEREPIIEKTELGTLGTFYRLQLGPFDDKRQSLQLCNSFKRSGVECFLVTQ